MSLLRLGSTSQNLKISIEPFTQTFWQYYTVRWGRKPRWLPIAPSKLYQIKLRPKIPIEEEKEIQRLFNNYRTKIKSLDKYFEDKYSVANQEKFDVEKHMKDVADDFARCSEINNQWNNVQKELRESRVQKELDDTLEEARQRLKARLEINAQKLEEAEQIVRQEKFAAAHFITPDKLDGAIEYAINNPVDYNFSLDREGNKLWGRETLPMPKIEDQEKLKIKQ